MSYTPHDEEINKEKFIYVTQELCKALNNRAIENGGGWNKEHRQACLQLVRKLNEIVMEVEEL